MYEIRFSTSSEKQLKKLDRKSQERIIQALDRIKVRPEAYVQKLTGVPGYKFRVGDYRLILDIDKGQILILVVKIGHRKNIYKNL